jgi:aldehyde:ferredoxin oxidoreductase
LKFAGYDAVVIGGRSDRPVYLSIEDGEVRFRDAERVWGMLTADTQLFIKEELGDLNARVACIGPAGENLLRVACIVNERRAAGRKGLGAVMGSKRLKAVAVRGSRSVPVADEKAFRRAISNVLRLMKDSPVLYPSFAKFGTSMTVDVCSELGVLAAKNYTETGVFAASESLGAEALARFRIRRAHCYRCPVGCSQVRLVRAGEFSGILSEGPEFESIYALGTAVGVKHAPAVIAADRLCDEYGLDTISAGVTIGFAMELYERGVIDKKEVDGIDLRFGNHGAVIELLRKMALREGFGGVIADGVRLAAERIGRGAEAVALHVKGLELPAYDVRGLKAHGLNYATSFNGADHNRGYAFQEIFGVPVPAPVDRFSYDGKAQLCKWNQDVRMATCDCPTMCAFLLDTVLAAVACEVAAEMVGAVSGLPLSAQDVLMVGERVNNLARVFNVREGLTRVHDTLPGRLMEEPIRAGGSAGQRILRHDLDRMLDEYYEVRGWDKVTGMPTEAKLAELGLCEAATDLASLRMRAGRGG